MLGTETSVCLYKFRSAQNIERLREIIVDSRLYFSSPAAFNDPFDCLPRFESTSTPDERRKWFRERLLNRGISPSAVEAELRRLSSKIESEPDHESLAAFARDLLRQQSEALGVLSLSERWDHVLLWSHYADSHRGVCLRFLATNNTPFFSEANPVHYSETRPVLNYFRQSIDEQVQTALMTKASFWAYESEWRAFNYRHGPGAYTFPPMLLTGIILGLNTPVVVVDAIRQWISDRPWIELMSTSLDAETFSLSLVR
jgi:hypothetical protein